MAALEEEVRILTKVVHQQQATIALLQKGYAEQKREIEELKEGRREDRKHIVELQNIVELHYAAYQWHRLAKKDLQVIIQHVVAERSGVRWDILFPPKNENEKNKGGRPRDGCAYDKHLQQWRELGVAAYIFYMRSYGISIHNVKKVFDIGNSAYAAANACAEGCIKAIESGKESFDHQVFRNLLESIRKRCDELGVKDEFVLQAPQSM